MIYDAVKLRTVLIPCSRNRSLNLMTQSHTINFNKINLIPHKPEPVSCFGNSMFNISGRGSTGWVRRIQSL